MSIQNFVSLRFSNQTSNKVRQLVILLLYFGIQHVYGQYTVTLMDDTAHRLTEASTGAGVILPAREGCEGYRFAGWTATWTAPQTEWTITAPEVIQSGLYYPTTDIHLYPVYTKDEVVNGFQGYQRVEEALKDWSGRYLLSTGAYTADGTYSDNHLLCTPYTPNTEEKQEWEFTLTKILNVGYSIQLPDGYTYIGGKAENSTDFRKSFDDPSKDVSYLWKLSTDGITNVYYSKRKITCTNNTDFRLYQTNTNLVYLYKRIDTGIQTYYISIAPCPTPPLIPVIEWQEDGIVVMYPEEATDASISWEGSAPQSVAITPIDHAVYKLTINDLSQKANQSLALRIGTKEVTYTVPYMITNGHDKIADHGDIVVLSNGSFTAQGEIVGDVTVYGGGQLVIPENQTLTLNTLTMRVGGIENGKYQHQSPQLILRGTLNNTAGHINIDYITTYDRYYALSLPYAVETTDIHYPQDIYGDLVSPSNKGSFALQYYDGYARATTGGGWMDVQEPARLNPYQGYTFWGAPKKVNIHGTTERQLFGIHRIPMRMGNEELDRNEKTDKVIAISAYEADRPNDSGWNFIGNPYLAPYQGDIGYSTEQLRYITTTTDGKNYQSIPVATASIAPLHAYFVQAGETSDLSFEQTNRVPLPLQARKEHEAREMTTGLVLYGPDHTDCMGLLIAEHYTEAYEYNADLAKFENQDINIFAIGQTGKLAYMAIHPELAIQQIPIGYSVPDRGVYTLAWDEAQHNNDDIIALYLIDKDNGQVTNLIALDYTFNSEKGANTARFALQVAFAPNNATRAIYLEERAIELTREGHTIHMTNLPLDTRVTIYNAIGHMVEQSSVSYSHQWTLPTGYYLMDIRTKQSNRILNTIIP